MERALEKVLVDAIVGSRKIQTMSDDLETMFEMWTGYMYGRTPDKKICGIKTYSDESFNLDGYEPSVMPVPLKVIAGMTSIGVDLIKHSAYVPEELMSDMLLAEAETTDWLLFTIIEQGHPLKGLRYVTGIRDGEMVVPITDPMFTSTYEDEHFLIGGTGCFIDKRERLIRAVRPEIFE